MSTENNKNDEIKKELNFNAEDISKSFTEGYEKGEADQAVANEEANKKAFRKGLVIGGVSVGAVAGTVWTCAKVFAK